MRYSVILFHSTNYAMWAADLLKKEKIKCRMISVPRDLSSDCGYCVRISTDDREKAKAALRKESVEFDKIEEI